MKKLLLFCLLYFALMGARGQGMARRINFNPVDKDSLDLALNDQFMLIEDSCATVTRHIRMNFATRKFHGKFTDVRKDNPAVILTEGNYDADGLKDGIFTVRYSSGNIRAKGNFKNNDFDGRWEMFYDDGKPQLTFDVKDGVYSIVDAWNNSGSKIIDKGNGSYIIDLGFYAWKGKLVNGKPDGAWKMYQTRDEDKQTISTEHFKKGEFVDGENQLGNYTNSSRIKLIDPAMFPFINGEKMMVGLPCNAVSARHNIVNAHYKSGMEAFNNIIGSELSNFFRSSRLENPVDHFNIVGEISAEGRIENLQRNGGSNIEWTAKNIIKILERLPKLIPATVDGKPVTEKFKILLELSTGSYSYRFQFMPLMLNN